MQKFIGREKELSTLQKCVGSDKSEFVVIYGRRRIGKTFLVRTFFSDTYTFYFVGSRNDSTKVQLINFSKALKQAGSNQNDIPQNWSDAFDQLAIFLESRPSKKRKVLFFDEMPWIDRKQSDFVKALEYFWNSWVARRDDILLIACGSATSWMVNNLIQNQGGLHNRITRQIHLQPFTLHETKLYLTSRNFDYSDYQIAQCYMTFGGVPFYLSLLEPNLSLDQNINMLFFKSQAPMQQEFDELYNALFSKADKYIAVVQALSQKKKGLSRDELIKITGVSGGRLTQILTNLERSDFITTYSQFGNTSHNSIYKLTDFYTLFYYKFVYNNHTKDDDYWMHHFNDTSVKVWQRFAFELLSFTHIAQIRKALGISGIATSISTWRNITVSQKDKQNNSQNEGAQIDLLIDRIDKMIHLCEIKFSENEYTITKAYAEKLRKRAQIFKEQTKTTKALVHTFITVNGVKVNPYSSLIHSQITIKDLFIE